MKIKEELYVATKGSSLFDYCLFNSENNKNSKNKFLLLLLKSLNHKQWFKLSQFSDLGNVPFNISRGITQVPFADSTVKNEEYHILSKVFTEKEIKQLIHIIKEMKSYGVVPIKELMDEKIEVEKSTFMRSAFFQPFFKRKK